MAKKKENKYIGYLVLSIIPLIGIVWAVGKGVIHNKYVKEAQTAEHEFEAYFKDELNKLDASTIDGADSVPTIIGDLNITSAKVTQHPTLLDGDKVNVGNRWSYTVELGANPTKTTVQEVVGGKPETPKDDSTSDDATDNENATSDSVSDTSTSENQDSSNVVEREVIKYGLTFEFFISGEEYTDLCESYDTNSTNELGVQDYIYQTYNKNNPKNSPVYKLRGLFDKHKTHINYYDYDNTVYCGISYEGIYEMIANLGEITYDSKAALDKIETAINQIMKKNDVSLETVAEKVANYSAYEEAKIIYEIRVIEHNVLLSLPNPEDITFEDRYIIDDQRKELNKLLEKLTDDQKGYLSPEVEEKLKACEKWYDIAWIKHYVYKASNNPLNKLLDDGVITNNEKKAVENVVNRFNGMTYEYKMKIDADTMKIITDVVNAYNVAYPNAPLTLNMSPDEAA